MYVSDEPLGPRRKISEVHSQLLSAVRNSARLEKLSNEDLVDEVLRGPHSDDLAVLELMSRVDPGWVDRHT